VSKAEALLSPQTQIALARAGMEHDKENRVDATSSGGGSNDIPKLLGPVLYFESHVPKEATRRTRFRDLKQLLSYCAVVYGGDVDKMSKTATHFGRDHAVACVHMWSNDDTTNMQDFATGYGCSMKTLRKPIHYRLRLELDCRERWPLYVSYAEDAKFGPCARHFNPQNGHRVVMHDSTNIPLPEPS